MIPFKKYIIKRLIKRWNGFFEDKCLLKAAINLSILKIFKRLGYSEWFYKPFNLTGCIFIYNDGIKIRTYTPNNIILTSPKHEFFSLKLIKETLHEGDVFIDVGAYTGYATLRAAKIVGNNGLVVAIEPDPRIYKILIENITINNLNNVITVPIPISENQGMSTFLVSSIEGWSHIQGAQKDLTRPHNYKAKDLYEFKTITINLDQIVSILKLQKVSMIKIDVEGAEYSILKGSINTLNQYKPKLLIEIHSRIQYERVISLLKELNYKIKTIHKDTYDEMHRHIFAYI